MALGWLKGFWRLGMACLGRKDIPQAIEAFAHCWRLDHGIKTFTVWVAHCCLKKIGIHESRLVVIGVDNPPKLVNQAIQAIPTFQATSSGLNHCPYVNEFSPAAGSPEVEKQLIAAIQKATVEQLGAGIMAMLGIAEQQVSLDQYVPSRKSSCVAAHKLPTSATCCSCPCQTQVCTLSGCLTQHAGLNMSFSPA